MPPKRRPPGNAPPSSPSTVSGDFSVEPSPVSEVEHPNLRIVKDLAPKPLFPYDDIPPPPTPQRKVRAKEYTTEMDVIKQNLIEARKNAADYEAAWAQIRQVEQRLESEFGAYAADDPSPALRASTFREEELRKRIHELETLLDTANPGDEPQNNPDIEKYGTKRRQIDRTHMEDDMGKMKQQSAKFQHELYMGEAIDTKMGYRLKELELENVRLRKTNAHLQQDIEDSIRILPTAEYLQRANDLFNDHHNAMHRLLGEADAMLTAAATAPSPAPSNYYFSGEIGQHADIPPNILNEEGEGEAEAEEEGGKRRQPGSRLPWRGMVYCGRCNMLVESEKRGEQNPVLVHSRVQGETEGKGIGLFVGDKGRIGYPRTAATVAPSIASGSGELPFKHSLTPAQAMRAEAAHTVLPPKNNWAQGVGPGLSRHTDDSRNAVHQGLSPSRVGMPLPHTLTRDETPYAQGLRHTHPNRLVFSQDKNWPGK